MKFALPLPLSTRKSSDVASIVCRLEIVTDRVQNEAFVMSSKLDSTETLFQLDTGYAGPPVLSSSFLADGPVFDPIQSTQDRYTAALKSMRYGAGKERQDAAVKLLHTSGRCRAFSSGCTMRLMGIGETSEMQADMMICPSIQFRDFKNENFVNVGTPDADVLVTHPLSGSVHILTCDYLLHRAPCVLCPSEQKLYISVNDADQKGLIADFEFFSTFLVGGAFCVTVNVGEVDMRMVVDTGASSHVSCGRSAAKKIRGCSNSTSMVTQVGVHGERVCSDVIRGDVRIGATGTVSHVPIYVNEGDVEGSDGYIGIGLLKLYDIWLEPHRIGFRRNRSHASFPTTVGVGGSCSASSSSLCSAR